MKFFFIVLIFSTLLFANVYFSTIGYQEIKKSPSKNSETIKICGPQNLFFRDSIGESQNNDIWYRFISLDSTKLGWLKKANCKKIEKTVSLKEIGLKKKEKREDRKRRRKILKKNKNWPRRIKKNVKQGLICLGMTAKQLEASWNSPSKKATSFILGLGDIDVFIYNDEQKENVLVFLKDNGLVGWSH